MTTHARAKTLPGLPLSPEILAGAYSFLLTTPPFRRWPLPDASEVRFKVIDTLSWEGDWSYDGGRHVIRISRRIIGYTDSLMQAMGHEMIHAYQHYQGVRSHHGREFYRLSHMACRYHGWDPHLFIGITR